MTKAPAIIKAERKTTDILDDIYYSTESLVHLLVRGFRNGMPPESGTNALNLIRSALDAAEASYKAAIAQPENKVAARPVVNL